MQRNLVPRECLSEDVRGHVLSWAILDVDVPIQYGLMNKMKPNINVFGSSVIVVVCGESECGLIITIKRSG